jgi:ERCC4-type nuclease
MSEPQPIVEPKVGQIYKHEARGEMYQILFAYEGVVLLRSDTTGRKSGNAHRIERRDSFENQVEAGYFEYLPDSDLDLIDGEKQEWSEVTHVGKKTAYKLHRNGFETALDVQQADDEELLEVAGLGEAGLENLREFIQ